MPFFTGRRIVVAVGLSLCLTASAFATEFEVAEVGDAPQDRVTVEEAGSLSHIAAAMKTKGLVVGDLLDSDMVVMGSAPDPTALLEGFHKDNAVREVEPGSVPLTVLDYNVGLLSRKKLFGFIDLVEVPEIQTRRGAVPATLAGSGYDIIVLQEVWEDSDAKAIAQAAKEAGYLSWSGTEEHHHEHGLQILVKSGLMGGEWKTGEYQYEAQYSLEYWPGPDIKRGVIWVGFDHPHMGRIWVVSTHLTPFPDHWPVRVAQSRELALVLSQVVGPEDLTLVGGDMNAGAYYKLDSLTMPEGEIQGGWWANAISYGAMLHYMGGVDLFAMGTAAQDVGLGDTVIESTDDRLKTPGGSATWCGNAGEAVFTASDCNSLYYRNYGGTEWPSRMDQLLARDPTSRIKVLSSGLAFTKPIVEASQKSFELSDHYGVEVTLSVKAKPGSPWPQAEADPALNPELSYDPASGPIDTPDQTKSDQSGMAGVKE